MASRRRARSLRGGGLGPRHSVLVVACAAAALAVTGSAWGGPADVAALQVALRIHGAHRGAIDGIFGSETQAAVRRFQHTHGLVVDGVPGPRTLTALGPFATHRLGSRLMRGGMRGWDVAALQYLLTRCDLPVGAIDGVFGSRTRDAVVRYQRRARLTIDGRAGDATVAGLRRGLGCAHEQGRIPRGVTVSGIDLGGLSARWASVALHSAYGQPLRLRAGGRIWLADPDWLATPRIGRAVRRALHARPGTELRLRVAVQSIAIRRYARDLDHRVCHPPVGAQLVGLRSLRPRISRARAGCRVLRAALERILVRQARGLSRAVVRIPTERLRPAVTRANFGPIVVIRRGSHRLYLYQGLELERALEVGTGRSGSPTPLGRFRIVDKIRRPWWYPPASAWADGLQPIPPGPGNPLGTRWMGLSARGVGIHGTPDAASVGYSRSHGCVRMFPQQAEWLFRRVRIGTPVIIVA